MEERELALKVAHRWLDFQMDPLVQMVPGDPDCDACAVARQLIRALERVDAEAEVTKRSKELVDYVRNQSHKHITVVELIRAVDNFRKVVGQ